MYLRFASYLLPEEQADSWLLPADPPHQTLPQTGQVHSPLPCSLCAHGRLHPSMAGVPFFFLMPDPLLFPELQNHLSSCLLSLSSKDLALALQCELYRCLHPQNLSPPMILLFFKKCFSIFIENIFKQKVYLLLLTDIFIFPKPGTGIYNFYIVVIHVHITLYFFVQLIVFCCCCLAAVCVCRISVS